MLILCDLMTETLTDNAILCIGIFMGILAAYSCDWSEARNWYLLSYPHQDHWIQVTNRILFVLGCILCLLVDFPSRADWAGKDINFILFPFIGFFSLCLTWCLSYNAMRIAVWIFRWCFDNK